MIVSSAENTNINPMDLSTKTNISEVGDVDSAEKYDSCGAMDLSSSCSSSLLGEEDIEDQEKSTSKAEENRKRKAVDSPPIKMKKDRLEEAGKSMPIKVRNKRRNIKEVMGEDKLQEQTKEAQAEEQLRLFRLAEKQKQMLMEAFRTDYKSDESTAVVSMDSSEEEDKNKDVITVPSSDSDECRVVSDETDNEDEEDPNNSGMHVNDALNTRDAEARVLVNVGHPGLDKDIFLAPQLAQSIKPHQIGGVRFLYDNIIESSSRLKSSPGFGCILAHNMGLGKTMQIVSFVDVFLGKTEARKVLCIVPINTIQNWVSEFNYWLPPKGEYSKISTKCPEVKHRDFPIHVLNDSLKNLGQRAAVISSWDKQGGVLMMGYELYRQLANKRQRRRKGKGQDWVDIEEEARNNNILQEVLEALVDPGPDLVVCDEGHRIKNSHASISQALKQIRTRRRIVLTGYPLQNNLMEYWCMVDFVRPNFLGNKTEFSNMFERPIQNGQCIDSTPRDVRLMKHRAHVLHVLLKGFVQRRGHVVLKDSLPRKHEYVLFVRMTDIQRRLYKRFMEELISDRCVSNPLKAFAVCCKIWNHPDVLYNFLKKKEDIDIDFDPEEYLVIKGKQYKGECDLTMLGDGKKEEINYDWAQGMLNGYLPEVLENSNKLQIFIAILEESVKCGDRLLLFSQSLCTLNLIENFLKIRSLPNTKENWKLGVNYYRLDGSTSALERERLINAFNADSSVKLFLVSTRAGSLGVNLVGANRVVIFDASWNPCHDTQAVCRVYRYGQTKETHVYRLVTDNSLEKKIYDRQINKQGMSDRIVDELNPDAHLSSKEVHSLICDEAEDPEPVDMGQYLTTNPENVMKGILAEMGHLLTKVPFSHESLLVDRKDSKLSKAEKKIAENAYKLEKTSKITYSRPSYAAFYPKQGTFATNLHNPGSNGFTRNRYYENGKRLDSWISPYQSAHPTGRPVASVRPLQADAQPRPGEYAYPHNGGQASCESTAFSSSSSLESAYPTPTFSNVLIPPESETKRTVSSEWTEKDQESTGSSSEGSVIRDYTKGKADSGTEHPTSRCTSSTNSALSALSKQGVEVQQITVPRDLVIPTGGGTEAPLALKAGQSVMVIRTPKGIYLRMDEKIIKIKQAGAVSGLLGNLDTRSRECTSSSSPENRIQMNG